MVRNRSQPLRKKQGSLVENVARWILGEDASRQWGMESRKTLALGHHPKRKGLFEGQKLVP